MYTVKRCLYRNNDAEKDIVIVTGDDYRYIFDAETTKLFDIEQAIKWDSLDYVTRLAKYKRPDHLPRGYNMFWILVD